MESKIERLFQAFEKELPLSLDEGGSMEAFNAESLGKKMKQDQELEEGEAGEATYKREGVSWECLTNLFWQDILWTATPGIPLNENQLKEISQKFLPKNPPSKFPYLVVVAVTQDYDVTKNIGALKRISPEDLIHFL